MVIKPKKQDFWDWGLHHYATKQPYNVVRHHIKTNTKKNDLVLDPFCGTGVTGIQSLFLKRKSIQFDINPLASFISETVPQLVNLDRLKNEFYKIFPKISELEKDLYSLTSSEIEKYSIKDWYPKNIKLPENSDFEFVHD